MHTAKTHILLVAALTAGTVLAQDDSDAPDTLLTPDRVETERLGSLHFFDGMPDEQSVTKVYDNLDFSRGVEAFLSGMSAASLYALCHGFEEAGIPAHTVGISEEQTMPGEGFAVILRLYGPLEPWFDKTWKPGDLERTDSAASVEE